MATYSRNPIMAKREGESPEGEAWYYEEAKGLLVITWVGHRAVQVRIPWKPLEASLARHRAVKANKKTRAK